VEVFNRKLHREVERFKEVKIIDVVNEEVITQDMGNT